MPFGGAPNTETVMSSRSFSLCLAAGVALLCHSAMGQVPILAPGDFAIAIDTDPPVPASGYPAAEAPSMAIDFDENTKYLNFGGIDSGFIVSLFSPAAVQSFDITTANDAVERDPSAWALYGTNDAISSADNSDGMAENWTLVDEGMVDLPDERMTLGPVVPVMNSTAYASYRFIVTDVKDSAAASSMQFAEIQLYNNPDGNFNGSLLFPGDPILAVDLDGFTFDSSYPAAEAPAMAIDNDVATKYLNFGEINSGLILTPAAGPSVATSLQLTTANDAPERDPASFELYGTNDPITSADNSEGMAENWDLITSGSLALPDMRDAPGDLFTFANEAEYASYRFLVTGVKDEGAANSTQFAELQLFAMEEMMMPDLPGDYNGNGQVEQADLDFVLLNWGASFDTLPAEWVNERPEMGIVDQSELDGVLLNWGATAPASTAASVPEPASLAIAWLIGAMAAVRSVVRRVACPRS